MSDDYSPWEALQKLQDADSREEAEAIQQEFREHFDKVTKKALESDAE
jgi:hypothetical protein